MSIKAKRGFWLGVREVLFIALTFVMMLPIYYLVITTFKTPYDATNHPLAVSYTHLTLPTTPYV